MERLYGGAMSPDDQEPEVLERRRAAAQAEADRDAYWRAQARGRWSEAAPGMAIDAHPHDAPPAYPLPPPTDADVEDDPTGRRRYLADMSEHVMVRITCTAEGCDASDIYLGREDRLQRIREAGGPRCTDHPLELENAAPAQHLPDELDHPLELDADELEHDAGTPPGQTHRPHQAPTAPPQGAPPGRGERGSVTPGMGDVGPPGQ